MITTNTLLKWVDEARKVGDEELAQGLLAIISEREAKESN
jgi:hypothetical protein